MKRRALSIIRSLRFRLIASVVVIEVIMLSLMVWSNIVIIHSTHTDRLQDTVTSMIQQIANTSGSYMLEVDYASLREYLQNVIKHRELAYIIILDRDGTPVVSLGELPGKSHPVIDDHPAQVDDGIYDTNSEISVAGLPMGHVLMGFSLTLMQEAISKARVRGIAIAATEIILTVLATVFIGLHLTRRLADLAKAAEEVRSGNYFVKVPTEVRDEVGRTAIAFNRMVGEVRSRAQQLEQAEAQSRQLLDENRQLVHTSLAVQEEERRHIARELHDELGQCITAIQADAESIRDLSGNCDPRVTTSAGAIKDVSAHVYHVVHNMMQRLRPGVLDDLGLVEALREAAREWQERNPRTQVKFEASGSLANLGEQINITLYRIVQECLTNITKHAHASSVSISLAQTPGLLHLQVHDDGRGSDVPHGGGGLGLIGMRERVEALGGVYKLESSHGNGFGVTVSLPVTGSIAS